MAARIFWKTLLLTSASATAAVLFAAMGFLVVGRTRVDLSQGLTIAAVVALILTPAFVFPLVRQQRLLTDLTGQLRKLADEDDLTGLSNRRSFLRRMRANLERDREEKASYAVLMVDLDYFKSVNDRFGHAAGDAALAAVARNTRRAVDLVAPLGSCVGRLGGEEFAIYLGAEAADEAPVLAEVVRQVIRDTPIVWHGRVISLTASIGVAVVPASTPVEHALRLADEAAYEAKSSGRDRWVRAPLSVGDEGSAAEDFRVAPGSIAGSVDTEVPSAARHEVVRRQVRNAASVRQGGAGMDDDQALTVTDERLAGIGIEERIAARDGEDRQVVRKHGRLGCNLGGDGTVDPGRLGGGRPGGEDTGKFGQSSELHGRA